MSGVFCKVLKCHWISWTAMNFGTLELVVREGDCPDMIGCIKVAKSILKTVVKISVRDEIEPRRQINFYYYSRGKWRSV